MLLPPEYNPNHKYPTLVVLHDGGGSPQASIDWWAGTTRKPRPARRRGYIVVAPQLPAVARSTAAATAAATDPAASTPIDLQIGPKLHQLVHQTLVDARRRFRIDSDRIYLAGHGQGADAAFEIGMSHPDWFAAVVPIARGRVVTADIPLPLPPSGVRARARRPPATLGIVQCIANNETYIGLALRNSRGRFYH